MLSKIQSLFNFKKQKPKHLQDGEAAEKRARKHLEFYGFKTIATNVFSRFGEIDIVMTREQELLFVEVRYRMVSDYGTAAQSIHIHKQRKLINAARYFLQQNPEYDRHNCRFDVITIESPKSNLQWHPCAFSLDGHHGVDF